jgi:transcriptional regulator
MYTPAVFAETRLQAMHSLIEQYPLATLVTSGPDRLDATHVPTVLHRDEGSSGVLRFHLARANPQWKAIAGGAQFLLIFQGPQHYISPSWYPSKQELGQVVPTWNYVAVHVQGQGAVFQEPEMLLEHLRALTDRNEAAFSPGWSIDDAPHHYLERLCTAIVGVQVAIGRMEGKWKVSQNRPESDRAGVVAALQKLNTECSNRMAALVAASGPAG